MLTLTLDVRNGHRSICKGFSGYAETLERNSEAPSLLVVSVECLLREVDG